MHISQWTNKETLVPHLPLVNSISINPGGKISVKSVSLGDRCEVLQSVSHLPTYNLNFPSLTLALFQQKKVKKSNVILCCDVITEGVTRDVIPCGSVTWSCSSDLVHVNRMLWKVYLHQCIFESPLHIQQPMKSILLKMLCFPYDKKNHWTLLPNSEYAIL